MKSLTYLPVRVDMTVLDDSGAAVGAVDLIVFEPYQDAVVAAVVKAVGWRPVHRLLPARRILRVLGSCVETDLRARDFEQLDRYEEKLFRHPPGSWAPPNGWRPGRVRWPGANGAYPVGNPPPPKLAITVIASSPAADPGTQLSQHEQLWLEERERRYAVDPDDVLLGPPLECCRTPYEWGDASVINPTEKGRQRGLREPASLPS